MITLEVLDERIQNLAKSTDSMHNDIKTGFMEVKKRQDITNGRVKNLEMWRATLIGASLLLTIIIIPIGVAYLKTK